MLLQLGPCHPSAHGVFRLALAMSHEQCSYLEPLTGLLYRASEYLSQTKLLTHLSGYLSRMDYVAHLNMESMLSSLVPYHTGSSRSSSSLLSHVCCLANHILNICCSIGDTGCISFILWGFDDREAIFLEFDRCYGARLHLQIDLEGIASTDSNMGLTQLTQLVANRFDSLTDLLSLRFNTARLLSTIPIDSNLALISSITGPLLQGSGSVMDSRSSSISYSRSAISVSHGGTGSCSLVRLYIRRSLLWPLSGVRDVGHNTPHASRDYYRC
jgi:NADH:ubiquinone oxidoreductase subunit D